MSLRSTSVLMVIDRLCFRLVFFLFFWYLVVVDGIYRSGVNACGRLGILLLEYIQRDLRLGFAWNAGVFWLIFINDMQITLSKISAIYILDL